ncbi:MAG: hypothetical protein DRO67_00940 [Candidatus Asgardarchaeum californiense]|nr:MAG: hypothetical protein DRO67_00940 [Candidatus Asgardarchaeum californiense]
MITFKKGNFLDETKLTREEAIIFLAFLKSELVRHEEHLERYYQVAVDEESSDIARITAQTVVIRNLDDIKHTQRTIDYLEEKFEVS